MTSHVVLHIERIKRAKSLLQLFRLHLTVLQASNYTKWRLLVTLHISQSRGSSVTPFLLLKIKDSTFIEALLPFGHLCSRGCSLQNSKRKITLKSLFPRKKASEFEEMLQVITRRNCYFLFELAHEYQIASIVEKSINLMVSMVKNRTEYDVLGMLICAPKYEIKSLISTCMYEARRLTLQQLKGHGKRDRIEPDNYLQIAEGIIKRLEEHCKEVKVTLRAKLQEVSRNLYNHGLYKGNCLKSAKTTTDYLNNLQEDRERDKVHCNSLSPVADMLLQINVSVESLSST